MNDYTHVLDTMNLDPRLKEDLILLAPHLSAVEQFKIRKAVELQSYSLLKLVPIKYFSLLKELRSPEKEVVSDNQVQPEETAQPVQTHIKYVYDDFSWSKLIEQIEQQRPNSVAVESVLKSLEFLGEPIVDIPTTQDAVPYLDSLENLSHVRQLSQLDALHVTFLLDENPDQKLILMTDHFQELTAKFSTSQKRGVFLLFLRSPLFYKYTFTGLSALNIQTEVPRKTLLNVMHQNDDRFLNHSQFEWCAKLVRTLRTLCIV